MPTPNPSNVAHRYLVSAELPDPNGIQEILDLYAKELPKRWKRWNKAPAAQEKPSRTTIQVRKTINGYVFVLHLSDGLSGVLTQTHDVYGGRQVLTSVLNTGGQEKTIREAIHPIGTSGRSTYKTELDKTALMWLRLIREMQTPRAQHTPSAPSAPAAAEYPFPTYPNKLIAMLNQKGIRAGRIEHGTRWGETGIFDIGAVVSYNVSDDRTKLLWGITGDNIPSGWAHGQIPLSTSLLQNLVHEIKTVYDKVKANMDAEKQKEEAEQKRLEDLRRSNPWGLDGDVTDALENLRWTGVGGGRFSSVDLEEPGSWSASPRDRQRLDHYVGQHYSPDEEDDPEGWDEEGWEDEYAGPLSRAVQNAITQKFGPNVLIIAEIGEKGHVEITRKKTR